VGYGKVLYFAELYDPATQTWIVTNCMQVARCSHSATRLTNGSVLVWRVV